MALFTGAIAGGCVGIHGIVGMGRGIAAGIVPMIDASPLAARVALSWRNQDSSSSREARSASNLPSSR
jgi:hypothetical protein